MIENSLIKSGVVTDRSTVGCSAWLGPDDTANKAKERKENEPNNCVGSDDNQDGHREKDRIPPAPKQMLSEFRRPHYARKKKNKVRNPESWA